MKNTRTVKLLRLLEKKELKEFKQFIHSRLFNKNKKCIELLELLLPFGPHFTSSKLDDEDFAISVYSNKNSLNTLMNDVVQLIEKFLAVKKFQEQDDLQNYFLLEKLREKREHNHYQLVYNRSVRKLNKRKKNIDGYYDAYLFEVSRLRMLYQEEKNNNKAILNQLVSSIHAFDKYTFANRFWLDNAERKNLLSHPTPFSAVLQDNSRKYVEMANQKPYSNEILIHLHLLLYSLLANGQEGDMKELFNALKTFHPHVEHEDHAFFYKYLINYCVEQVNKGDTSYHQKLYDIYQYIFKMDVFKEGKYLDHTRLRNAIIITTKIGKAHEAHDILDQFIKDVNPTYQKPTEQYCRGYLCFMQKDYGKASDYLNGCIDLKDVFTLASEVIIYKIHYETHQDWAFDVPVQSFRAKLNRHKDKYSKRYINSYINFFKILTCIYHKKTNPNYKKSLDDLRQMIQDAEYLSDKRWLQARIDELDKGK